jgi:hypothetical protein
MHSLPLLQGWSARNAAPFFRAIEPEKGRHLHQAHDVRFGWKFFGPDGLGKFFDDLRPATMISPARSRPPMHNLPGLLFFTPTDRVAGVPLAEQTEHDLLRSATSPCGSNSRSASYRARPIHQSAVPNSWQVASTSTPVPMQLVVSPRRTSENVGCSQRELSVSWQREKSAGCLPSPARSGGLAAANRGDA